MPSPLAHTTMGYAVYRICRPRKPQQDSRPVGPLPRLLLVAMGLSLLPDLDSVLGILMGDFGRFHNNVMHSLIFGLVVALGISGVMWLRQRSGSVRWFIIALLCYELHVIMDYFTVGGRGVMLLWPFSPARYESSVKLFYGVRWSDGLISTRHLWTLVTELGFVVFVGFIMHVLPKKNKRPWL